MSVVAAKSVLDIYRASGKIPVDLWGFYPADHPRYENISSQVAQRHTNKFTDLSE